MWFERPYRTRGIECGPDRWVTLPAVMSLMETLRWEWLQDPELGLVDDVHRGHGFFVTEQHVAMARRFSQGVDVRALAALRKVGRVEARAEQALVDADGELVAHCTIRGVWTSPGGRLCRIPSVAKASVNHDPFDFPRGDGRPGDMASLFSPPAPRRPGTLDLPTCPPEITTEHARTMTVRSSDCDVFRHVNASNYLRYVADSLASQGASPSIHRARLHYLVQAKAHDTVTVGLQHLEDSTWFAELRRDDEVLFRAVVETEDTLAQ